MQVFFKVVLAASIDEIFFSTSSIAWLPLNRLNFTSGEDLR
jgi:hypothetical protein